MAWADGVIAEEESKAIGRLIAVAELTEEEREVAKGFLESKVELDTASMAGLSEAARAGIYRAALRLAMVDKNMAEEEAAMLTRLREGLGLSKDTAEAIEKDL